MSSASAESGSSGSSAASEPAAPTVLPALPEEGIERVLCVVAHPDDMEYGASAAVRAWTEAGVEVTYLLLTRGEAGMAEDPAIVAPLRAREQHRACEIVGVRDLRILEHPDGMLEATLALRRDIARAVRQVRPDLVLTANFDLEAYGSLNQADHRAAGISAADGTRDAANPWVFRELREQEGLEPWSARALLVLGHPEPTHAKAVSAGHVQAAVASLSAHEAYLQHVTDHPAPEEFIPEILRAGGTAAGCDHAVTVRAHDLGGLGD
ncbi:PIG-L deacetylase family protein [Brachybacterium fresconis]|uniref:LmbE family N-acetylglucosaminyl deacetylase n=1 Tax=Brachybacterium fresconis TaxID=173363 RepID=A0ABS4YGN8_9MICO|nr:PIG-L deacetylase family protein [Brachybacterium fresconis]MBP2407675.1 LmbE family N-acetylglucosaminyl deacetylase [Brachybacterium fresconis]